MGLFMVVFDMNWRKGLLSASFWSFLFPVNSIKIKVWNTDNRETLKECSGLKYIKFLQTHTVDIMTIDKELSRNIHNLFVDIIWIDWRIEWRIVFFDDNHQKLKKNGVNQNFSVWKVFVFVLVVIWNVSVP